MAVTQLDRNICGSLKRQFCFDGADYSAYTDEHKFVPPS